VRLGGADWDRPVVTFAGAIDARSAAAMSHRVQV
jgi:hypothetical protein